MLRLKKFTMKIQLYFMKDQYVIEPHNYLVIDCAGNKKTLTVTDEMAKYCWIIPVRNEKAKTTEDALKEICFAYGIPERIHSDAKTSCNERVNKKFKKIGSVS